MGRTGTGPPPPSSPAGPGRYGAAPRCRARPQPAPAAPGAPCPPSLPAGGRRGAAIGEEEEAAGRASPTRRCRPKVNCKLFFFPFFFPSPSSAASARAKMKLAKHSPTWREVCNKCRRGGRARGLCPCRRGGSNRDINLLQSCPGWVLLHLQYGAHPVNKYRSARKHNSPGPAPAPLPGTHPGGGTWSAAKRGGGSRTPTPRRGRLRAPALTSGTASPSRRAAFASP